MAYGESNKLFDNGSCDVLGMVHYLRPMHEKIISLMIDLTGLNKSRDICMLGILVRGNCFVFIPLPTLFADADVMAKFQPAFPDFGIGREYHCAKIKDNNQLLATEGNT